MNNFSYLIAKKDEYVSWALSEDNCPLCPDCEPTAKHLQSKHIQFGIALEDTGIFVEFC